eukprot:1157742-Pelagomonas_calceolata.AAC.4
MTTTCGNGRAKGKKVFFLNKTGVQPQTAAPTCSRPPAAAMVGQKATRVLKTRRVCSHKQRHLLAHAHQLRQW